MHRCSGVSGVWVVAGTVGVGVDVNDNGNDNDNDEDDVPEGDKQEGASTSIE